MLSGCVTPDSFIVVCGQRIPCEARVITFLDPQGFDAQQERCAFSDAVLPTRPSSGTNTPRRYGVRSMEGVSTDVPDTGLDLAALQARVDQFVVHYDACHDSTQCFEVLQDQRGLSVHFMLDLDGTIWQTLDLEHRARHATKANDRSIGIEIAQIGAYAEATKLARLYATDERGQTWLQVPRRDAGRGFLRTGCVVPTARSGLFAGQINGRALIQHDFTAAQYASLAALVRSLRKVFPRIEAAFPVDVQGHVVDRCLTDAEFASFSGVLGHFHIQAEKSDPGVAFDWTALLEALQR